ncbi:hypothetical protein D3C77_262300 [compost metagenome]
MEWKLIAACSTSVPSSGRNTALALVIDLVKSSAVVVVIASPPAAMPSREWRGKPPSQPPT